MLSANTEISPLFCHSSLLKGDLSSFKGYSQPLVWWHGFNPQTKDFFEKKKRFLFLLPSCQTGTLGSWNMAVRCMLLVWGEEWSWELNTWRQTVHQRLVGCRLCIMSNWVSSAVLLRSANLLFSHSKLSSVKLGWLCLTRHSRGTVECYSSVLHNAQYSGSESVAWFPLQNQSDIFKMSIKRSCKTTAFPVSDVFSSYITSFQKECQWMFWIFAGLFP